MTRFGFIIHPLDAGDVARKYSFARSLPDAWVEFAMSLMSPRDCGPVTGIRSATGVETEGWFVGCPLTAKRLLDGKPERCIAKIIDACRMAEEKGAQIIGLGAFTSVVGDAGITVAENIEAGITTGNSFTVATGLEGALAAADRMDIDISAATVAVLGATGAIGHISARILAPQVGHTILVGRRREALETIAGDIGERVTVETDIKKALADADIVVAVTSSVEAVVEPEYLKPGSVVCDIARPRDVSRRVVEERRDVLVIEGGVVAIPGNVRFELDFGFPAGTAYACMSETMILALEGRTGDYSLGRELRLDQVEEMAVLGRKHGFTLAGFRSFERGISDEEIKAVRDAARKSKIRV